MRVLIVEDEVRLARHIAAALTEAGDDPVVIHDGEEALRQAVDTPFDLIVLDIGLPRMDGLELLRLLRARHITSRVLILTARDEKQSIIRLLNAGADDYLPKPFDLGELLARAKALVRRGKGKPHPLLTVADLEINVAERIVRRGRTIVQLTPMEYRVLEYLASRTPAVVSKNELLEHLYDYNWEKFGNVIEVYISGLRRKIDCFSKSKLIHTLRGHGYALRADSDAKRDKEPAA